MLFHTLPFLVFMLLVLPVHYLLKRTRFWIPWLLTASYVFYGWWNPWYLLLIAYSTALDYLLVALMDHSPGQPDTYRPRRDRFLSISRTTAASISIILIFAALDCATSLRPALLFFAVLVAAISIGSHFANRKLWLVISIFNNLAILVFFKYARFLIANINAFVGSNGAHVYHLQDPSTLMPFGSAYILPVGISFFTFQSMSYTIDFYNGKTVRERSLIRFAAFVCFFPQLMAGPIERARQMLPQFHKAPVFHIQNLTYGGSLFLVGLFKKLALANYLSLYVDPIYANPAKHNGSELFFATIAFAWQIFFDFSGYTDMARGVAKSLGFELMLNFNNPYLATGLGDFWSRWHISLSTWFRDYLYIPLGGNRHGALKTYRNLFITFLVSGIWHGANWTFAIWGALHAIGIIATRELERSTFYRDRVPRLLKQICVFLYVCFAWIFFRAADLHDSGVVISGILHSVASSPQIPTLMLLAIGCVWLYQVTFESRMRPILANACVRIAIATAMVLYLLFCSSSGGAFIYFQF